MRYAFYLLCSWVASAHAGVYPVRVGDTTVIIKQYQSGPGKAFVHLHQNETTALRAAKAILQSEGGSVLTLVHPGQRNVVFHHHKQRYEFDPNRIFTDAGIKKTLSQFGPYSVEAHAEVRKLADAIKTLLPEGKIIAVHNNASYSLKDYFPGAGLENDAQALHYVKKKYYRNFYLVTQKQDYMRLKRMNFNSIWQGISATDDGSLSVYLSGKQYVNVEAGYDQLSEQINMLQHA